MDLLIYTVILAVLGNTHPWLDFGDSLWAGTEFYTHYELHIRVVHKKTLYCIVDAQILLTARPILSFDDDDVYSSFFQQE